MSRRATTSSLPEAFKLVHQILTDRPGLTTRELVREAVALYQVEGGVAEGSQSNAGLSASGSGSEAVSVGGGKGKEKKVRLGVNVVPDGHPFVSTSFLKHRVLPILASQDLITKSLRPASTTSSSPSSSSSSATSSKPTFTWSLHTPRQTKSSLSSTWSFPEHWSRLLESTSPGRLYAEYQTYKDERKVEEQQRGFASGKLRRSEREIWEWEGRKDGLTTNLERVGMNTRRRNARPAKERRRAERMEELLSGLSGTTVASEGVRGTA